MDGWKEDVSALYIISVPVEVCIDLLMKWMEVLF